MVGLNNRLKMLRKERHMTQVQVAHRVGVTKAMISAYETATRSPSYDILIRLAHVFGVTTDYLLGIDSRRMIDVTKMDEKEIELVVRIIDALKKKKE